MSTPGVFVVAITAEPGWGRTTVTGLFTFAAVAMMVGYIVVARIAEGSTTSRPSTNSLPPRS